MKIALYCPNKPLTHPNPSGDLVIAAGIKDALDSLGHECVEVVRFRSRWFWTSPRGWRDAAIAADRSFRACKKFKPNVWLTYHSYYKSPDVLGHWMSRLLCIPYVLFQPMFATRRRRDNRTRIGFFINRMALKACRHAFTNNRNDLEALLRIIPSDRITYIPPGIFPEDFQRNKEAGEAIRKRLGISPDIPVIITVARLRPGVKFESMAYLLNALAMLRKKGKRFLLMVVGDGPMEPDVRSLARGILPEQVVFCGRAPRENMPFYYSAADIFAYPGIGESLGMVYLEAQACGLPVVALDTAGVPQVVESGRTGLLVSRDDGKAMADAIERLLTDRILRDKLVDSSPAFIREHRNLHRNYIQLSRILEKICSGG